MALLYNLARMTTATTGTGTITLGSPVSGFLSFAAAGATDGQVLAYAISDGANSEIGTGIYTASGTTLTRTVINSTNSNTAISLSGTAQVFITPSKADIANPNVTNSFVSGQTLAGTTTVDLLTPTSGARVNITGGDLNFSTNARQLLFLGAGTAPGFGAGSITGVAAGGVVALTLTSGIMYMRDNTVGGSCLLLFDGYNPSFIGTPSANFVLTDPGAGTSKWFIANGGNVTNRYAAAHDLCYFVIGASGGRIV